MAGAQPWGSATDDRGVPSADPSYPSRKPLRISGYDYASVGAYFVTFCTYARRCTLGNVVLGAMHCNAAGRIVEATWRELPTRYPNVDLGPFIVMPNHVHAVVVLKDRDREYSSALSEIIRGFKGFTARQINEQRRRISVAVWQRGFYEHVIRNEHAFAAIAEYIADNPRQWAWDSDNPARREGPEHAPWLSSGAHRRRAG